MLKKGSLLRCSCVESVRILSQFEVPFDVLETIFKFLPSKVLLEASLVCHSWYSVIDRSKKCMAKIQISVKGGQKLQIKRILEQSLRRYENFKIEKIFSKLPHLKALFFYYLDSNILELASKLLTKLEEIDTNFITLVIPNNQIIFPHLKKICRIHKDNR